MKTIRVLLPFALAAVLALLLVPTASALPDGEYNIGNCSCYACAYEGPGARCNAPPECGGNNQYCTAFLQYHCGWGEAFFMPPAPSWMGNFVLTTPSWAKVSR